MEDAQLGPGWLSDRYVAVVRQYANGRRREALAALNGWTQEELRHELAVASHFAEAAKACRSLGPLSAKNRIAACQTKLDFERMPLRAAAMLHLDKDEDERTRAGNAGLPSCHYGSHAEFARQLASLVLQQTDGRDFARRLHLAGALRAHATGCFLAARYWSNAGLQSFPEDGLLQLVFGTASEIYAMLVPKPPFLDNPTLSELKRAAGAAAEQRQLWEQASKAFGLALSDAVSRDEAQLRRGHVLLQQEKGEGARAVLETLIGASSDPALLYMAHLFLGRAHENAGRLPQADGAYRAALTLRPDSQAAALALAYVLWTRGEPEAGARMQTALAHGGKRSRPDPYWEYVTIRSARAEPILESLRREVRP